MILQWQMRAGMQSHSVYVTRDQLQARSRCQGKGELTAALDGDIVQVVGAVMKRALAKGAPQIRHLSEVHR